MTTDTTRPATQATRPQVSIAPTMCRSTLNPGRPSWFGLIPGSDATTAARKNPLAIATPPAGHAICASIGETLTVRCASQMGQARGRARIAVVKLPGERTEPVAMTGVVAGHVLLVGQGLPARGRRRC